MMGRVGRLPYGTALAPLRGSARYAVFGLAAITIAGCDGRTAEQRIRDDQEPQLQTIANFGHGDEVKRFTDPATGCQYLIFTGYRKGGITPRLNPDGTPMCIPAPPAGYKVDR